MTDFKKPEEEINMDEELVKSIKKFENSLEKFRNYTAAGAFCIMIFWGIFGQMILTTMDDIKITIQQQLVIMNELKNLSIRIENNSEDIREMRKGKGE